MVDARTDVVRLRADVLPEKKGHAARYWGVGLSLHEKREHGVVHLTLDLVPAT